MNIGDAIIIKKDVSERHMKGTIISSLPGDDSRSYLVKIHSDRPISLVLKESEISKIPNSQDVDVLMDSFFIERGSRGVIVQELSSCRYLCEFTGTFCNIEVDKEEITPFNPQGKQFALLNTVRLVEDIPEHNLTKGMEGVIVLVFFHPNLAYCVEFFLGKEAENEWENYDLLPEQLEFVSEWP